jgi:hypothetical protein
MPNLLCPDDVTANGRYGWNENPFTVSKIRLVGLERRNKDSLKTPLEAQSSGDTYQQLLGSLLPIDRLEGHRHVPSHPIETQKFLFQSLLVQNN